MKQDTAEQIGKAIPAVVGAGITLSDVSTIVTITVGILTGIYVLAQLCFLLWKWYRLWRREMVGENPGPLDFVKTE